jgi:hypothetical protein
VIIEAAINGATRPSTNPNVPRNEDLVTAAVEMVGVLGADVATPEQTLELLADRSTR